jgi:hypothetical protein
VTQNPQLQNPDWHWLAAVQAVPTFRRHAWVLQGWLPLPLQFAPPLAGLGLLQSRVCVPPPQVALQPDQPDHPPFTGTLHDWVLQG